MAKKIAGPEPREGAPTTTAPVMSASQLKRLAAQGVSPPAGRVSLEAIQASQEAPQPAPVTVKAEKSEHRVVEAAELHSAVRMNGKLESNVARLQANQMLWIRGEGLLIQWTDARGQKKESLVPSAGVKIAHFA